MDNQIKTYYIPNNPNIKSGTIYTLYINNNTNLDLTSIISEQLPQNNNVETIPNKLTIDVKEYNKLLKVNKQIQETISKVNINIENFLKQEKQAINDLIKLNIEYNSALKAIPIGDDKK